MIIVLEGPDGGGKTVLANHLYAKYGWKYIHTGPPEPGQDVLLDYATKLWDAHMAQVDVVFDRLHVGERIYGPLMRNTDQLGDEGSTILSRLLTAFQVKTIFCIPPFEIAAKNWENRHLSKPDGEFVKHAGRYEAVYLSYMEIASKKSPNQVTWDYTMTSYTDVCRMIMAAKEILTKRYPNYSVGSVTPRFLFVGEKANQEYLDLPWVSLRGSSHYLFEAMQKAGYEEREVSFINAITLKGEPNDIAAASQTLGDPIVVTLGNVASELAHDLGIPHYALPHPAFWKRFHAPIPDVYVSMLKAVRDDYLGFHRVP